MSMPLFPALRAMRPRQWVKNLIVFAGLIFSGRFTMPEYYPPVLAAFAGFCLISSAAYITNDICDLQADREHPKKRLRPLAAGDLSRTAAAVTIVTAFLAGNILCSFVNTATGLAAVAYTVLSVGYSISLKHIFLLDVLAIALGFVLRAVAGALAIAVPISPWLIICTVLLSIFLALCKRRHELELLGDTASEHRRNLSAYSVRTIDSMCRVVAAVTILVYGVYTMHGRTVHTVGSPYLVVTVPFVAFGIIRYAYLSKKKNGGGDPSRALLRDIPLLVTVLAWAGTVCVVIILGK